MDVRPLADIVWIKRLPPEELSAGGIVLAHDNDYQEDIGVVKAVGPGKEYGCSTCGNNHRRAVDVRVGDKIIFSTHGHQLTEVAGEQYVVLREPSIIGVIERRGVKFLEMEQPV
jgi:chaperonin GroES